MHSYPGEFYNLGIEVLREDLQDRCPPRKGKFPDSIGNGLQIIIARAREASSPRAG